jgi:xanthine/uracil/vitamin C permease (AzgA family)
MPQTDKNENDTQPQKSFLSGALWDILGAMIGCSMIGYFLGSKWGDPATGTMVGAAIGLVYVVYQIWKVLQNNSK